MIDHTIVHIWHLQVWWNFFADNPNIRLILYWHCHADIIFSSAFCKSDKNISPTFQIFVPGKSIATSQYKWEMWTGRFLRILGIQQLMEDLQIDNFFDPWTIPLNILQTLTLFLQLFITYISVLTACGTIIHYYPHFLGIPPPPIPSPPSWVVIFILFCYYF
jgi:hypothetical protein